MKRIITLVCVFALLSAALCGCGEARNDAVVTTDPAATMDLLPEVSTLPTMDPEDGVVKDRDGVIEEHDTGAPSVTVSPMPSASPSQSARPTTSAKPSTSAKP